MKPGQQEYRNLLGAILRYHRVKAGLTQEEAAEQSGVSASTISEVERGACSPFASTVLRLCVGLSIDPDALNDGSTWNAEEQRWEIDPATLAAYSASGREGR